MAVKFYLDENLFTAEYRETGINHTAYKALRQRKETGNELLDFSEVIWDRDVPEIVDTLMRMGENKFTISSNMSSIIETLAAFEKYRVTIEGLTEVNSRYTDFITGERERIPALLMKVN